MGKRSVSRRGLCFASALHLGVQGLSPIRSCSPSENPNAGGLILAENSKRHVPNKRSFLSKVFRAGRKAAQTAKNLFILCRKKPLSSAPVIPVFPNFASETILTEQKDLPPFSETSSAYPTETSLLPVAIQCEKRKQFLSRIEDADMTPIKLHMANCYICKSELQCEPLNIHRFYLLDRYKAIRELKEAPVKYTKAEHRSDLMYLYSTHLAFYKNQKEHEKFLRKFVKLVDHDAAQAAMERHQAVFRDLGPALAECKKQLLTV